MGDVSDTRKQILQNTLTDELKKHFRIVPQEKYEQVLEVKNSNQNMKVMLRMVFQMVWVFWFQLMDGSILGVGRVVKYGTEQNTTITETSYTGG